MKQLFEWARLIIWLPIIIFLISSLLFAIYGGYLFFDMIFDFFTSSPFPESKYIATQLFSIVDIYLLVIIQYIFAAGLYELFIGEIELPVWLKMNNIDQLKAKLASVIILFLAVYFSQVVVTSRNALDILYLGIAIAVVTAMLVFYYKVKTSD